MRSGSSQASILPAWCKRTVRYDHAYRSDDAKVALAIELARRNVAHATGGPFGAAVFDARDEVVAIGVNRVEALRSSLAHAEIVALAAAQQRLGRARLHGDGGHFTLATSSQPCCQCYGAVLWAGIDTLLIGARIEDTQSLAGFDEGPLAANWMDELVQRGIRVARDLRRDDACAVLADYAARGGHRY